MDSHARPFDLRGDAWLFTELPDELLTIVMAHYTAHLRKRMLLSSVRWLAPWMDVQHIMGFTVRELARQHNDFARELDMHETSRFYIALRD